MNAKKRIKKYTKSIPMLRIFLSVCWGKEKEKDIAKDVGYSQPVIRQYLDQLVEVGFVKKDLKDPKLGQKGKKRVFYSPIYSKVVKMNIYPEDKVLREDWEFNQEPRKEKLMKFLNEKCERFLKIMHIQMFFSKNSELENFNLENLAEHFIKYLRKNKITKTTKYVNEYTDLFFGSGDASYLDESIESYDEFLEK